MRFCKISLPLAEHNRGFLQAIAWGNIGNFEKKLKKSFCCIFFQVKSIFFFFTQSQCDCVFLSQKNAKLLGGKVLEWALKKEQVLPELHAY